MKIPKYLKNIGVTLVICLILVNLFSIHKFIYTVGSWSEYFEASFYGSAIVLVLIALFMLISKTKIKPAYFIAGPILAFVYYNLCAGFIPFYINTLADSAVVTHQPVTVTVNEDFTVVYAEDDWQTEIVDNDHFDHEFEYKGYAFSESTNELDGKQIEFDCKVGLFGWEYIDVIRFK